LAKHYEKKQKKLTCDKNEKNKTTTHDIKTRKVNNKKETIHPMQVLGDAALPDTSVYRFMS
jgi:hypothetical protein